MSRLLDQPTLLHTRRNHALEHATLHVLSARPRRTVLAGHSDARGFYLLGEVTTEEVEAAVSQALTRLEAGEARLAVHANCGTNLITGAILAGSASFLVAGVTRPRRWANWLDQLPLAVFAALAGLVLAQPLGMRLQQRVTTEPRPGGMQVTAVHRVRWRGPTLHRIWTVH